LGLQSKICVASSCASDFASNFHYSLLKGIAELC
jgi:hypothetical protein